jgi:hypothetical protein
LSQRNSEAGVEPSSIMFLYASPSLRRRGPACLSVPVTSTASARTVPNRSAMAVALHPHMTRSPNMARPQDAEPPAPNSGLTHLSPLVDETCTLGVGGARDQEPRSGYLRSSSTPPRGRGRCPEHVPQRYAAGLLLVPAARIWRSVGNPRPAGPPSPRGSSPGGSRLSSGRARSTKPGR